VSGRIKGLTVLLGDFGTKRLCASVDGANEIADVAVFISGIGDERCAIRAIRSGFKP
jgi:hypothetical protein